MARPEGHASLSDASRPRPPPQALIQLQQRDGKLKLMHFRRIKQLGAGDVGLVDLVQLQVGVGLGRKGGVSVC